MKRNGWKMIKEPLYISFFDDYTAHDNSFVWFHDLRYRIISKDINFYYIVKENGKTYPIPRQDENKIYKTATIINY
jgi:hypothetical protein